MLPDELTFVDLETTGANPVSDRIIEIGMLKVRNGKLIDKYTSLINPEKRIDPFIEKFTGITQVELENAPSFSRVRSDVFEFMKDGIFVAHNARFDYGFLRNEFRRFDVSFSKKTLCTVRLARYLFPGFSSYSLDNLISRHDIKVGKRHRAYDDAKAIWDFVKKSLKEVDSDSFEKAISKALKRPSVPLSISEKKLDSLPQSPGVYIFYSKQKMPLYVGKSVNIRDRVLSHFSGDYLSSTDMKISRDIFDIDVVTTKGELGALFTESTLVKKLQPLFNKKLRNSYHMLVLKKKIDKNGFFTAEVDIAKNLDPEDFVNILGVFRSKKNLNNFLYEIIKKYQLCSKIFGLEKIGNSCFNYQLGICKGVCVGEESTLSYNLRFAQAFADTKVKDWPFKGPIVICEGDHGEDGFLFDKWCYLGNVDEFDPGKSVSKKYVFDVDTYKILLGFFRKSANLKKIKRYEFPKHRLDINTL